VLSLSGDWQLATGNWQQERGIGRVRKAVEMVVSLLNAVKMAGKQVYDAFVQEPDWEVMDRQYNVLLRGDYGGSKKYGRRAGDSLANEQAA
jgi:hypothetical protein